MTNLFKTLSARLAFWYAAVFVLFSGIALLIFFVSINTILHDDIDEDLEEDVVEMRGYLDEGGIETVIKEIQREIASDNPEEVFLRLLDKNGEIIFTTDTRNWKHLTIDQHKLINIRSYEDTIYSSFLHADDEYDARMISAQLDKNTIIEIGESMEDISEFMTLIVSIFIYTYMLVTVMASLVGWYIAKKSLSGVEAVSKAAIDVTNGSLNKRVTVKPQGEEVENLVIAFNMMLDRIRELIVGMREMTDNIAHDLRSQLGHIRANAEMSLIGAISLEEHQASAADTIEECDRLLHLINTILDVSEAEVGISQLPMQQVNISEIMYGAYELFEPIAEDKNINLTLNAEPDCYLKGHTQYLQRMLTNFLDNALKYTPANGKVGLGLVSNKDTVVITIHDTGIGIIKENQSRIYDRFFRCDSSRSANSNGLGLSFARAVVLAHNGDISLVSSPAEGSMFTVKLPI